jgi:glycosyltransferase involved in cell wall biosynthesis
MLDQLVVGAAPGDAITITALKLQEALSELGPCEVYARFHEGEMADRVRPLSELPTRPNAGRPLVFHASIGCWPVYDAVSTHEQQLVLVYHNFSPPEFFESYDQSVADDLVRGWWELDNLRDRVVLAIADSEFNASEMRDHGYDGVEVIPPLPDVGRLVENLPDPAMLRTIHAWGPGPVLLTVAQQLPHKRIERVLAAVAVLQQQFRADAHLALVGVERFPAYSAALASFADSVGARNVHFLGRVDDAELSALYLRSDAMVTMSDHEGFCVPVIEAMAAGLPVVASDRAALPETVGDAGLVVDEPDDPVLVAAVLDRLLADEGLCRTLSGRGVSRARRYDATASLVRYLRVFSEHLPELVGAAPTGAGAGR